LQTDSQFTWAQVYQLSDWYSWTYTEKHTQYQR
jgi:hypothetical protein